MSDLEDYAENTSSPLIYLQCELFNANQDDAAFAASHLGVCNGLISALQTSLSSEFEEVAFSILHHIKLVLSVASMLAWTTATKTSDGEA